MKESLIIRKEFVIKILDTLEDLQKEAQTNGESALLYQMLKTARKCLG